VLNTYLRMGYLLHLVTLAELLGFALLYFTWIENWGAFKIAFLSFIRFSALSATGCAFEV
jgi:hypothetical protein